MSPNTAGPPPDSPVERRGDAELRRGRVRGYQMEGDDAEGTPSSDGAGSEVSRWRGMTQGGRRAQTGPGQRSADGGG